MYLLYKIHSGSPLLANGLEGIVLASFRLVSYSPRLASYRLAKKYRHATYRIRLAKRPLNRAPPPFYDHLTRPDVRTGHSRTPTISPLSPESPSPQLAGSLSPPAVR